MELKLTYQDRSRLWADLLSSPGDRVFIATPAPPEVGQPVSILVEAPELASPLTLAAVVLGHRPATAVTPGGVFVQVDAPSLERCRSAIAQAKEPAVRTVGRKEARADCDLALRVVSPSLANPGVVRSLSTRGFTVKGASSLVANLKVVGSITLPDGFELPIAAQVIWLRPELELAGLQITSLDPAGEARLSEAIATLAARATAQTGVTVVVADDDPSILDFSFRAISKIGHRVLRAERGDTALALVRQERPRLVVLDVLMPGLDGLEVCKAIRDDEQLSRTPVVLLSAMGEARLTEAAKQAGANDYLTKPMRLEALRAMVAKYCS